MTQNAVQSRRLDLLWNTYTRVAIAVFVAALLVAGLFGALRLTSTHSPDITTDQFSYGPEDLVTLSGVNFIGSQDLDVVVTVPDGSVYTGDGTGTPGFDGVTADGSGDVAESVSSSRARSGWTRSPFSNAWWRWLRPVVATFHSSTSAS